MACIPSLWASNGEGHGEKSGVCLTVSALEPPYSPFLGAFSTPIPGPATSESLVSTDQQIGKHLRMLDSATQQSYGDVETLNLNSRSGD